jgi:hypothetical protein
MLEAFTTLAPAFTALALPCLEETRVRWEFLLEAGVKLPREAGDYPEFTPEVLVEVAARRAATAAEVAAKQRHLVAAEEAQEWAVEDEEEEEQH